MLEFGILGPLEARSGGEPVDLGPPKQRALLALLLLHVGRVVPTDRILEELWGADAAGKEKALWVHISRLRSALEPERAARGHSSVLVTRDHGYSIRTDPASVDACRFEAAVGEARARLDDDPKGAAENLRTALGLWRGSALQDFTYDEFAQAAITRLEELRLEAIETRLEADLRRGLAAELIGELEVLIQQYPLRERPVAQLMRALYRAGRQAEALRAFQRYRSRVGEELGLSPSPELRRLEEQILLHDERLAALAANAEAPPATNPFKGLHAFQESDAADFFGRDRLVAEVLNRVGGGGRLVALVGPSGSGKSSVARAGVVPALRKGALPGSERWLVASMVPGADPFAELEAGLLRATINAPDNLETQLADPTLGLLRAALRLLPDDTAHLVLVIDQFEELFTLVDNEADRRRFIANLVAAADDPRGRVLIVVTLRADAYHRPLAYGELAARLGPAVINVLPLTSDELEEAAQAPAARHGVTIEPALLAELINDVIGEPGALPVFQYALTELFEHRNGDRLSVAAYRAMGGVRGVLSRRADDLYHRLTPDEQEAARQLFLRLVTVTEHEQWSRRRVPASEIVAIDVDVVTMESVIDQLGRHRFLAFDRDHGTGAPTVEVAHEALLSEWERLRGWIDDGRIDITRRAALDAALAEWNQSHRDGDYLLAGNRLAEYERWRAATTMRLTVTEHEFLDASAVRRDQEATAEAERAAREAGMARRARRRWWALVAVVVAPAAAGAAVWVIGPGKPPSVAMLTVAGSGSHIEELMVNGLERAARDFDFEPVRLVGPFTNVGDELASLAASGTDLVLFTDLVFLDSVRVAAADYPDTTFAYIDVPTDDAPTVTFAEHEGAFLAGAAAALTSETGTLGFVGGLQLDTTERFRAGFEAGARAVDPGIEILATYTSFDVLGFTRSNLALDAASQMYERGADIVLHAAGPAGAGVFTAAREQSARQGRHLWAIGADSDQYLDVPEQDRPHVLTSAIKRYDVAVYELIRDHRDGGLEPVGRELTLADGAVGYSTSGDHLSPDSIATIEQLEAEIISGNRTVPRSPSGPLQPPPNATVMHDATVRFDGSTCRYDGPESFEPGEVVHIELVNTTRHNADFGVWSPERSLAYVAAQPGDTSEGYAQLPAGRHPTACHSRQTTRASDVRGPTLDVQPAPPTPIAPGTAEAEVDEVARGFLDAYGTFDADRALSYMNEEAIDDARPIEFGRTPEEFRRELAVVAAFRYRHTITGCEQTGESPAGIAIRCAFDLHEFGSDEVGLGPYTDNYWELTVRDGQLTSAASSWAYTTNGSSRERWEPFAAWLRTNYPDEILVLYTDDHQVQFVNTEEAVLLLEQRVDEFVAEERDRLEAATAFLDAWIAGDGAAAVLAPDGTWEDVAAGELPALLDWMQAVGASYRSDGCRLRPATSDVECQYAVDNDLTRFLGVGPIANRFVVKVADGAITEVDDVPNQQLDDLWSTFAGWVAEHHPDDVDRMFVAGTNAPRMDATSIEWWGRYVDEFTATEGN